MSLTAYEEARIALIEEVLNELQVATSNLAAKQQVRQLILLRQTEIDSLTTRVAELERLITILEQRM